MTEEEWLNSTDPNQVFKHIARQPSPRTRQLFACACCRHVYWTRLPAEIQAVIEFSERYADGLATESELDRALRLASDYEESQHRERGSRLFSEMPPGARAATWAKHAIFGQAIFEPNDTSRLTRSHFYREIYGNGFHAVTLDPSWLDLNHGAVRQLAQSIYQERTFADLPFLADALEEAGCSDAVILDHLRSPWPHVRGCWALDLILGKS
jgi:hypothetical protein